MGIRLLQDDHLPIREELSINALLGTTNTFAHRSTATTIFWPLPMFRHYYCQLLDLAFTPSHASPPSEVSSFDTKKKKILTLV